MSLSTGASSVISTAVTTLGDYVFGKGARNAAKDAAKAQKKLADLQAQEQELKNYALAMSLSDQNQLVPFQNSLPGSSYIKGTSPGAVPAGYEVVPEGSPEEPTKVPGIVPVLVVGSIVAIVVLARRRR